MARGSEMHWGSLKEIYWVNWMDSQTDSDSETGSGWEKDLD